MRDPAQTMKLQSVSLLHVRQLLRRAAAIYRVARFKPIAYVPLGIESSTKSNQTASAARFFNFQVNLP